MKNKVIKQMLAFSLAVALVGGNSVATDATNATEATATFSVDKAKGYFSDFPDQDTSTQRNLQEQDHAITYFPAVVAREGYVWTGWEITDQD